MEEVKMFPPPYPQIPWFGTEADRDRRYDEWVAAGGAMASEMACWVAPERLCIWRDGKWFEP
jgi:hypothetical protein